MSAEGPALPTPTTASSRGPWASHFTLLGLSLLVYKVGVTSGWCWEEIAHYDWLRARLAPTHPSAIHTAPTFWAPGQGWLKENIVKC